MIFDTHAHYDDEAFDTDREVILAGLSSRGVDRVANVGVDIPTCEATLALAEKYDFIYAVIGFHPSDIRDFPDEKTEEYIDWLRTHRTEKTVAVGEIGLDYHWSETEEENRKQQRWFRRQIALAKEQKLPIVVHSREAAADTMNIIREEEAAENGGIIHCYSYSAEQAREYVKMGFMIGVGGVITFKNSRRLRETVEAVPLENIVLETDCPYLAPEPHRGKRNDSGYLPLVVAAVASIKNKTVDEVINQTTINAEKVYHL